MKLTKALEEEKMAQTLKSTICARNYRGVKYSYSTMSKKAVEEKWLDRWE